ncbi:MAG: CotH kinase family protein, partial [Muribaculaceae bacterium]|nr:CotH kinase family protein [Muribaculaceae bacterium]
YLFRDFGDGQKWHFSPLWDCGNAFRGPTNDFFYNNGPFGNTWISSLRQNEAFNRKVEETWKWFMANRFDGLYSDIDAFVDHVKAAAEADYRRWNGEPSPAGGEPVADNRDMSGRANYVKDHLNKKIDWLSSQFGSFNGEYAEPERDATPAMPLPAYVAPSPVPDPEPEPVLPTIYLRGDFNGWDCTSDYQLTQEGNLYSIHLDNIEGKFKFATSDWNTVNLGGVEGAVITETSEITLQQGGFDLTASRLSDVTFSFLYNPEESQTLLKVEVNGTPEPVPVQGISGTLPVLYINVYTDAEHTALNNEIISRDLDHKNYFQFAEYRLDTNGCEWLKGLGAEDLGSEDNMLPL